MFLDTFVTHLRDILCNICLRFHGFRIIMCICCTSHLSGHVLYGVEIHLEDILILYRVLCFVSSESLMMVSVILCEYWDVKTRVHHMYHVSCID